MHLGALFRFILGIRDDVFSLFVFIFRFRGIFLRFGRPRDPPGHHNTMKIIVPSSEIKVSRISKNYAFWVAFGALGVYFGHHFGRFWNPWGSLWRPLGPQSVPKVEKRAKNEILNRHGRPEEPKGRPRRPRTSKMDHKSSKNQPKN